MNLYEKYILPKVLDSTMKGQHFAEQRDEVVKQVSGIVLEIGFGTGLNIPHYEKVAKLYALEPAEELWKMAQTNISQTKMEVVHLPSSAESIPLEDSSVDCVVSTWTLCSIPDIQVALREVKRVLRPQGKFVFIDHGQSPKPLIFKLQNLLTPVSKRLVGGCHLNRNIEHLVSEAGLKIEMLEKFAMKAKPLAFMYKGIARKPKSLI